MKNYLKKSKILVVKDNSLISLNIIRKLKKLGYDVTSVFYDGKAAIDNLLDINPDIALIDIKLNGNISGIETAKIIRLLLDIPIIYLSAYTDIPVLQNVLMMEPFDYILKPFDERILQMTIELALHKHKTGKRLIESEAQYRSIAKEFNGFIYTNDSNYNIKFLNKKLRNKIGKGAEKEKCYKAVYGLEDKCSWCPMEQILKGEIVKKLRYDEIEKSWFKEIHTPLHAAKGQILKQSMLEDITKQQNKQKETNREIFDKEVIFNEIHHRMKNNLQVISSLLNIQSSNITDKDAIQAIKESRSRVNSMILIHDKLYNTKNYSHINFEDYLKELTAHLLQLYASEKIKINFTINAQNVVLDVDTAVPAGLIVNELITNSLKHAFNNHISEGKIDISLKQYGNGEYFLRVIDNGIGMPGNFNPAENTSLGMQIVSLLTKQIAGEMKVNIDNGTEISIKFKEFGYRERGIPERKNNALFQSR